tara:strand:- start:19185 stop:19676 length:492 start_codon:yes stop_codon:yes gene_type:complete
MEFTLSFLVFVLYMFYFVALAYAAIASQVGRRSYATTILTVILGLHVVGVYGGLTFTLFSLDTNPYDEKKIQEEYLRYTAIVFDVVQALCLTYLLFQYRTRTYANLRNLCRRARDPVYGLVETNVEPSAPETEFTTDVVAVFTVACIGNIICLIKFVYILQNE